MVKESGEGVVEMWTGFASARTRISPFLLMTITSEKEKRKETPSSCRNWYPAEFYILNLDSSTTSIPLYLDVTITIQSGRMSTL